MRMGRIIGIALILVGIGFGIYVGPYNQVVAVAVAVCAGLVAGGFYLLTEPR